jgi:archaellum component FlaC
LGFLNKILEDLERIDADFANLEKNKGVLVNKINVFYSESIEIIE